MTFNSDLFAFVQIVLIDMSMAGDNAIAVGIAASGLPMQDRRKAVLGGIAAATVLRIILAVFAVKIMHLVGLMAAGGLLLLWVAWKMHRDIRHAKPRQYQAGVGIRVAKKLSDAVLQIAVADISMSLDNVLAVAGVARDHIGVLTIGLVLSVAFMGVAAAFIARLTSRYSWIAYIGLVIVLITALHMIWDGGQDIWRHLF